MTWHIVAVGLYAGFAVYLYWPHFVAFTRWDWLLPVSASIAAFGAYLLSRRWVAGLTGSLLAGALYGFGPFILGLAKFHPTSSLLAAGVPWLFIPAAVLERKRGKWVGLPLWLLPFVVIALFSYLSAGRRLFAAPLQANVRLVDLAGFIAPLALVSRTTALLGVYHIPLAALLVGLVMVWKARRYGILFIAVVGFVLAFSRLFLDAGKVAWLGVSPILWLSIPMVWCSVLCGIGLHGLIEAGPADRKWVLAAVIVLGLLAIVVLLLAAKCFQTFLGLGNDCGRLFLRAALLYLIGAAAGGIIFFLARQGLRLHWLRWAILCIALGLDIFLGATYIADKVF